MQITHIVKRDGSLQEFDINKTKNVIQKALVATQVLDEGMDEAVAARTELRLKELCESNSEACINGAPSVEEIQDTVEKTLMEMGFYDTAKAYILYRSARNKTRARDLFKKRTQLKPYEYPELAEFGDAIRHSYWIHTEFNYTSDVQDFHINVTTGERDVIKKTMLAIAQIEVAVKTFWGNLYSKMPKPEIGAVGFTFAESEVRHMNAYSHLLEILGLNDEFKYLTQVPVIKERIDYLEKVIAYSKTEDPRDYALSVLLFSLFIEHVSLFSQFLIIMSFNKHKNLFKGISNVVEATSKEEQVHGLFGIDLINILRGEHPEWFDETMQNQVEQLCLEAYDTECRIVDWIFESGELSMLPKQVVKEFIKQRLNNSLIAIKFKPVFSVDQSLLESVEWFDNEIIATKHVDFFQKRSINYNKRSESITGQDLF